MRKFGVRFVLAGRLPVWPAATGLQFLSWKAHAGRRNLGRQIAGCGGGKSGSEWLRLAACSFSRVINPSGLDAVRRPLPGSILLSHAK